MGKARKPRLPKGSKVVNQSYEDVELDAITPHPRNARKGDVDAIVGSIDANGFYGACIVQRSTGHILAGNHRYMAARESGMGTVPVIYVDVDDATALRILLADNRTSDIAGYDDQALAQLLTELAADGELYGTGYVESDVDALLATLEDSVPEITLLPTVEPDEVPDAPAKTITRQGDVWQLGPHRVMCGDSTDVDDILTLMGERQGIELLHADPPYGMGKEGDGVANDNLRGAKLDAFQMEWWKAWRPYLADNASAYVWGNAPDLWRLWWAGGLESSESLTMRNEIVWNKGTAQGQNSADMRSFAPATERCLFFMLGEQSFTQNADSYWEGWEPLRTYLAGEIDKVCESRKEWADALGNQMGSHYFTKSQWALPTREAYGKLQAYANGRAFERSWEDLRAEYDRLMGSPDRDEARETFYGTRAHFNNTHSQMTDVWEFSSPVGDERHGHATPKPVDMIVRAIRSSCPAGGTVVEPFGGTGSTLVAAQVAGVTCLTMELLPKWVDVICRRWQRLTGERPVLVGGGPVDFEA